MIKTLRQKTLTPFWCLFILTGLNLFNYLDRFILASVLTPMKEDLHLSDGEMGHLATMFMIGYFVTSPFFGYLGDRLKRKWLIAVGVLIWSIATMNTGLAATFSAMIFWRILVGLGEASYATMSPSLLSDVFPSEKRNNALTIFYAAIPVGSALGYLLGGFLGKHYGWREAFLFAGAPGLLLALSLLPFREPERGQVDGGFGEDAHHRVNFREIISLFKIKEYNLTCWGYTAYSFALGAYAYWGPTFLHRAHKIDSAEAAMFFGGVLVVAGLVGTLVGGFLATRWHKKSPAGYAWMCSLSVFIAGPLSLIAFWTNDVHVATTCLASTMFFAFLSTGPVNTLIVESSPSYLRSSAMAVSIFLIHMFGDMWSPEIVGHLADHWGRLEAALSILPMAFIVAGVLWAWLALYQKKQAKGVS